MSKSCMSVSFLTLEVKGEGRMAGSSLLGLCCQKRAQLCGHRHRLYLYLILGLP